jgi:hypothetical protein
MESTLSILIIALCVKMSSVLSILLHSAAARSAAGPFMYSSRISGNTIREVIPMESDHLCLSDLLDQDLSAFEYFQTLPREAQQVLYEKEISSFNELQEAAAAWKSNHSEVI